MLMKIRTSETQRLANLWLCSNTFEWHRVSETIEANLRSALDLKIWFPARIVKIAYPITLKW